MNPAAEAEEPVHGVCHFTISGAWLTEHVRERILSDMEDSALSLLVDHLEGMTYEIALSILRGQKRLIGVTGVGEGIELANEEPEVSRVWVDTLMERYENRCELLCPDGSGRRGWFRPHAYITDFGPKDIAEGPVYIDAGSASSRTQRRYKASWLATRLWHYAGTDEVALSTTVDVQDRYPGVDLDSAVGGPSGPPMEGPGGGLGFLFAPCSNVPGWLRVLTAKTPTDALRAHLRRGSSMEARGHSLWYPDEAAQQGRTVRGMLVAAEEKTAQDPRNPPAMRADAAQAAKNLRAAEAAREGAVTPGQTPRQNLPQTRGDAETIAIELRAHGRCGAVHEDSTTAGSWWVCDDEPVRCKARGHSAVTRKGPYDKAAWEARLEADGESVADAEARQERTHRALLATYAASIRAKAGPIDGPGWFTMTVMRGCPAEFTVRVPLAPFQCWALWRTTGRHLMPAYTPVCPSGMRLNGDDPYHSDWMLGAFPEQEVGVTYRDPEIRSASVHAQAEIQATLLGFTAAVLSGRGYASGKAIHPAPGDTIPPGSIVILPNARPEYESVVRAAAATIVPVGGELCHLAVVAGEAGRIIVRVAGCLAKYPPGTLLSVDTAQGKVTISDDDVFGPFGSRGGEVE